MITPEEHAHMLQQWRESGSEMEFLAYWGMSGSEFKKEIEEGVKHATNNSSTA